MWSDPAVGPMPGGTRRPADDSDSDSDSRKESASPSVRAAGDGAPTRVFVDGGDYRHLNMGDLAMLQVALRRLEALWPDAELAVLSENGARLVRACPGVVPVPVDGRRQWLAEQEPFARAWKRFPLEVQSAARSAKRWLRFRRPSVLRTVYRWNRQWHGVELEPLDRFYEAFYDCGAAVLSGAGGLTDHARGWGSRVLDTLEIAIRRGLPAAVFGHGLGPLTDPELVARARAVLPQVSLLALREGRFGPALADELGVDPSRVFVTGDDAIEPALDAAPANLGDALGVNLRLSPSSGIGVGTVGAIRQSLAAFVRFRRPALLAAPIAFNEKMDGPESARVYADDQSIRLLLEGVAEIDAPRESLDTPEALIRQIGRTRVVVTAAYHAAVFALAQGVPAVCLGASPYFLQKFDGLAHQFGPGCRVVRVRADDFERSFTSALTELWDDAESHRAPLRAAARRQVEAGYEAYWAFQRLVEKRT